MKRTIAVAVILALGTGIPGPGCYQALAQVGGGFAELGFGASETTEVGGSTVRPVFLTDISGNTAQKANFKSVLMENLQLPEHILHPVKTVSANFHFRQAALKEHIPAETSVLKGGMDSVIVVQEQTTEDALSENSLLETEKITGGFGKKSQATRFWHKVSQMSAKIDPSLFFDGVFASAKSLISPQYGRIFSAGLTAAGTGTIGNLQMPLYFANAKEKVNPEPPPSGWTGNGGLRDSGDRNHDITVLRFNLGLILGPWRAILINTDVNSAQKLNIKLANYFRENLNDWLVKTRAPQPIQDHIVVFTQYLAQVLSSENWPGANISEYSEAVEKKLDEISAEIGKAKSISDLEKAGLFIVSSEGQIEQLNSGSTQISDPTKSLLRIYLRAGLGASLLGVSPWFVLWQYYLFGCLAFVCGLTIFTRAFFDCLRWMRLNR